MLFKIYFFDKEIMCMRKILLTIVLLLMLPTIAGAQKVGLVLSGGGARGLAHVGVIKALEENNIPIDYVAGTSMGAIVAALYSMGYSPQEMYDILASEDFRQWYTGTMDANYMFYFRRNNEVPEFFGINFDVKDSLRIYKPSITLINPNPMSLGVMQIYAQYTTLCDGNFDKLFVPFRCVAADIYNKKQLIFKEGDLGDAVRASMSYPFVFKPIKKDSILMYDGGIYNNFPVDVMQRDFNPDIIVGSIVSKNAPLPDTRDMMSQIENLVTSRSGYNIEPGKGIVLDTELSKILLLDFDKLDLVSGYGYQKTMEMMDSIKKLVPHRRSDSLQLANRRAQFRSRLPRLRFKRIEINGVDPDQQEYIKSEFHTEGKDIFTFDDCKRAYFRLLSGNVISGMTPRAVYNPQDSTYTLMLDVEMNPPFTLKMGGALSTDNSNQIYFGLHYRNLNNHSKEFILDGQLGKVYNNVQLSSRVDFASKVPLSLRIIGSYSTIDYYNMKYIFAKENPIALNHEREVFVKLKMVFPFLLRQKAEFGIGIGNIKDQYLPSNIINLDNPYFDTNRIRLFGGSLKFEGNTLDSRVYSTSGMFESMRAQFFVGKERFDSRQEEKNGHRRLSWLQMSYNRKDHFYINRFFTIGTNMHLFYSTRGLSSSYQASMMQAGAYTPTMSSMFNYDPAFRANQFIAGGVTPIYKMNNFLQFRAGFYGFTPYRKIKEGADGAAYFSKKHFSDFQYIAEFAAVARFSSLMVSGYVDYYSSKKNGVNAGLTLGWFMFNERFIE